MFTKLLRRAHMLGITPGFTAVSQGVAVELVDRCCDPSLTDADWDSLVADAANVGFELTRKPSLSA